MNPRGYGIIDPARPVNWEHPLLQGLAGWWIPVPNSGWRGGLTLRDVAKRNHATLTNGPIWRGTNPPGGYGSILYDGSNDFTSISNASAYARAAGSSFTFGCWCNFIGSAGVEKGVLCLRRNGNSTPIVNIRVATVANNFFFRVRTDANNITTIQSSGTFDGWRLLIATYAVGQMRLYINGVQAATGSVTDGAITLDQFHLGKDPTDGVNANILIGETFALNRALSAAGAMEWYKQSKRGHPDTLNWLGKRTYQPASFIPSVIIGNVVLPFASRPTTLILSGRPVTWPVPARPTTYPLPSEPQQ